MTTVKFDNMPTKVEMTTVDDIKADSVQKAWNPYQAKPEYKEFNKHDMIEELVEQADEADLADQ
ncbi:MULTISPECIES: NF038105 family protein [unclassified Acinetobacter]|uniref:NF038105 family protein n=1 Tax=unclassified Acinetobacter TaxID=196816 RepID=UPI0035BB89D7